MTDRELLEKAARAAGIVGSWEIDSSSVQGREYFNVPYDNHNMLSGFEWNPLREDGDALRLEAALLIDTRWFKNSVKASALPYSGEWLAMASEVFNENSDTAKKSAAKRRAIVRAAAAIADSTAKKSPQSEG
jgi:hypothetical protein